MVTCYPMKITKTCPPMIGRHLCDINIVNVTSLGMKSCITLVFQLINAGKYCKLLQATLNISFTLYIASHPKYFWPIFYKRFLSFILLHSRSKNIPIPGPFSLFFAYYFLSFFDGPYFQEEVLFTRQVWSWSDIKRYIVRVIQACKCTAFQIQLLIILHS